ncbi:MAG: FecR family protein [Bryobacteraceae bacterium]
MRSATLLLAGAVALGADVRYARIGQLEGRVEVEADAPDGWRQALNNAPASEGFRIRTGPDSRVEIELDEGSAFRLGGDALCELSDYARLSTGPRITRISLDRGVAWFTGEAAARDSLVLAMPGAQLTIREGARVRIEVADEFTSMTVIEGRVQFLSVSAELELSEGQMARVNPAEKERFFLHQETISHEGDDWSESRDQWLAQSHSSRYLPALRYGLSDLDRYGAWIETGQGPIWKPSVPPEWTPFAKGRWVWYRRLGYTWIAAEPWGWLPYHYGRWNRSGQTGWVWSPGRTAVFKPGEVFWLRGPGLVGWGPLAPGEDWNARNVPSLYLSAYVTFAKFAQDDREINPEGFAGRPKDPLSATVFQAALPSPALPASRLEAVRAPLRVQPVELAVTQPQPVVRPPLEVLPAPEIPPPVADLQPQAPPVIVTVPVPTAPVETYYVTPVYTGIVVVNPPPKPKKPRRPPAPVVPAKPPEPPPPAAQPTNRVPRGENRTQRAQPIPQPPPQTERNEAPIPRSERNSRRDR